MLEILQPHIVVEETGDFSAKFIVEPLERGFGHTLGNVLRRVLLSSLPGAAVTSLRIEGVAHEFSTIPGVKEDVVDIFLNVKQLVLKLSPEEPAVIRIVAEGPKEIKARDIIAPSQVEIINPDLHIATLSKKAKLEMEMVVESGRGYVAAERNKKPTDAIGVIPVDSLFSPVRSVAFTVEDVRVRQRTDYNKLILEVTTNGSIKPAEAVNLAAKIINDHMILFMEQAADKIEGTVFASSGGSDRADFDMPIEDLELSVRAYNCLKRCEIHTLNQLLNCSEQDLLGIRNFGAKSIEEIKGKLSSMNLSLK